MAEPSIHPAQYSKQLLRPIADAILEHVPFDRRAVREHVILDPCAGLGHRFHDIADMVRMRPIGVEIEPGYRFFWSPCVMQGDSTNLAALAPFFQHPNIDAACTSVVYPNGMADDFNAEERCRFCRGQGLTVLPCPSAPNGVTCEKCNGTGRRDHVRNTYAHRLRRINGKDYRLHPNNAAGTNPRRSAKAMARFHEINQSIYREVNRVLRPGAPFVVNVKDTPYCSDFTQLTIRHLFAAGFSVVGVRTIAAKGNGHGQHQHSGVKADHEALIVAIKPRQAPANSSPDPTPTEGE